MLQRDEAIGLNHFACEQVVSTIPRSSGRRRAGAVTRTAILRISEILNIENEGESHDIVENKGPDFLSHDVDDGQWFMRCQVTKIVDSTPNVSLNGTVAGEGPTARPKDFEIKESLKFFPLPWNVIENKGPKMRKMGQTRIPWNVFENTGLTQITLEYY